MNRRSIVCSVESWEYFFMYGHYNDAITLKKYAMNFDSSYLWDVAWQMNFDWTVNFWATSLTTFDDDSKLDIDWDVKNGRIHFFLEISKLFQKVMTFFEIKYPVFKKFFKNVLEKPKPFWETPRKSWPVLRWLSTCFGRLFWKEHRGGCSLCEFIMR
jgi:hypothetical protein